MPRPRPDVGLINITRQLSFANLSPRLVSRLFLLYSRLW